MCGSAQKVMNANKDKKNIESLTRMQDELFAIEKEVMDAGEATEEQKVKARDLYNRIMRNAGDLELADEMDGYMKQHIDSIEKGDPKPGFGRTDIKEDAVQTAKDRITKEKETDKKKEKAIATAKSLGYKINPVNINSSSRYWEVKGKTLYSPLSSIKGLGAAAMDHWTRRVPNDWWIRWGVAIVFLLCIEMMLLEADI